VKLTAELLGRTGYQNHQEDKKDAIRLLWQHIASVAA